MPTFAKNPKFIVGTVVVLWVLYVIWANYQLDAVKFYMLPLNMLVFEIRLSGVIVGAAIFGSLATLLIQWLWRRPSNDASSASTPAPSNKTVA